jgi:hypothetical protein
MANAWSRKKNSTKNNILFTELNKMNEHFSSLTSTTLSVGTLLQRNTVQLSVADWQRRYAWDEPTAQQFLSSLWPISSPTNATTSAIQRQQNLKQYFIGCMYTSADRQSTRLLDGQQRLVTCMLMIAAACSLLSTSTINSGAAKGVSIVAEFGNLLFRNADFNNQTRLVLGSIDHLLFARILRKGLQREDFMIANNESSPTLSVYNRLVQQLREKIGVIANGSSSSVARDNRLLDFLYALRDRVFVMLIDVPTVSMAVSVFSSINRPSIPLNDSDIFLAETMKLASSESDHRELRTQFDVLRSALPEPDQLTSLANIVRTILLQRCLMVAEFNVEHNKRYMKEDTLPTLRALLESGSTRDFFAFVFESFRPEANQQVSLFSCNQRQDRDDWRVIFNLFVALGTGLHDLLEQSNKVSFLRVMSLDVVVALRGQNPWLLVDDSTRATGDSLEENRNWLACVVLLATLEKNDRRLICEQLLGNFADNNVQQFCLSYERLLLHQAKVASSAVQLSAFFDRHSREFLRSLLSHSRAQLPHVTLIDRQYVLDFGASTKTFRWLCRYFLQRYADLVANAQTNFQATRNVWRAYQVEHICPRVVDAQSDWRTDFGWTNDCIELDRLGNLTLVTAEQNATMSNGNWSLKRIILASLPVGFRVTNRMWTMFDAEERREAIVNALFNDWNRLQPVAVQIIQTSVQNQRSSSQQKQPLPPPPKQQHVPSPVLQPRTSTSFSAQPTQSSQPPPPPRQSLVDEQLHLALAFSKQLAQQVSQQQQPPRSSYAVFALSENSTLPIAASRQNASPISGDPSATARNLSRCSRNSLTS